MTAYFAEQWGRRWITIDTSRVPLALTRQRLLTATFPFYDLSTPGVDPWWLQSTGASRTARARRSAGSSRTSRWSPLQTTSPRSRRCWSDGRRSTQGSPASPGRSASRPRIPTLGEVRMGRRGRPTTTPLTIGCWRCCGRTRSSGSAATDDHPGGHPASGEVALAFRRGGPQARRCQPSRSCSDRRTARSASGSSTRRPARAMPGATQQLIVIGLAIEAIGA